MSSIDDLIGDVAVVAVVVVGLIRLLEIGEVVEGEVMDEK